MLCSLGSGVSQKFVVFKHQKPLIYKWQIEKETMETTFQNSLKNNNLGLSLSSKLNTFIIKNFRALKREGEGDSGIFKALHNLPWLLELV